MKILVTGGAGYIGSHTVRQLGEAGHGAARLMTAPPEDALAFHRASQRRDTARLLFDGRRASIPGAAFAGATQIDGQDDKILDGRDLDLNGDTTLSGFGDLVVQNGAGIHNDAAATFDIDATADAWTFFEQHAPVE